MRNTARIKKGWIGFDLDCTLAVYEDWVSPQHIGEPIMPIVNKVKELIYDGQEVKIFTARAYPSETSEECIAVIKKWCKKHIGTELEVVYAKDQRMIELWDDRVVQVIPNSGRRADGLTV